MALLFSDQHYRDLFDSIDQGFCTIEILLDEHGTPVDYRFLDVNAAFAQHTGLENAVGRRMRELIPAHDDHWFRIYGVVALTGEPLRFEQQAAAMGRWYDVYAFRVGVPERRTVGVLFTDISAKKQAQQNLYDSEARYRALAHATANSLFRISADGVRLMEVYGGPVASHNRAAEPSATWFEDYVHPDDVSRARAAWQAAVAAGTMYELEHRGRFSDGSWRWIVARAVPVRNEHGDVIEWIGSASDITERKEAEEALRRSESGHAAARLEAERANVAKDEFLAMVGHELRNPLAPMLTALQLMRLRGINVREQEVLERQVDYLARMVDDLLDTARITRGKVELRRTRLELCEVVVRGVEIVSPLFEQRHHALEVLVPREGLGVHVDPDRMAQVISNLLANAAKYSEPGSTVAISAARDGGIVSLRVRDHGLGLAPDALETIFHPFVQQAQAPGRSIGGLGLGLAIVRSLVEAHGGTVRAESEGLDRGSQFVVDLPAVDLARGDAPHSEPSSAVR